MIVFPAWNAQPAYKIPDDPARGGQGHSRQRDLRRKRDYMSHILALSKHKEPLMMGGQSNRQDDAKEGKHKARR